MPSMAAWLGLTRLSFRASYSPERTALGVGFLLTLAGGTERAAHVRVEDGPEPVRAAELDALGAAFRVHDDLPAPPSQRPEPGFEVARELPPRLALGERLVEGAANRLEDVGLHRLGDGEGPRVRRLPDLPPVPGRRVALRGEESDRLPGWELGAYPRSIVVGHGAQRLRHSARLGRFHGVDLRRRPLHRQLPQYCWSPAVSLRQDRAGLRRTSRAVVTLRELRDPGHTRPSHFNASIHGFSECFHVAS